MNTYFTIKSSYERSNTIIFARDLRHAKSIAMQYYRDLPLSDRICVGEVDIDDGHIYGLSGRDLSSQEWEDTIHGEASNCMKGRTGAS